jgi:hypothetical protein
MKKKTFTNPKYSNMKNYSQNKIAAKFAKIIANTLCIRITKY